MAAIMKIIIVLCGLISLCRSQIELDDSFLEQRNEGMWLVEFYAPWCGHCKKLEPIFREVAREFHRSGSPIRVGKVDCTRFSNIASEFGIRGFPTIIFINKDKSYHHRGDRTKEGILEFAQKAQGPTVRRLSSIGKFNEAHKFHGNNVFFLYIGDEDEHEDLYQKYVHSANVHMIHSYFYQGKKHIMEGKRLQKFPTLLVFKDGTSYEYQAPNDVITASDVQNWINRERYPSFPMLSGSGLNEAVSAAKYLVILGTESEKLEDFSKLENRVYTAVKQFALSHRENFHSEFQFLWMPDLETVNSIAMSFMTGPVLMVLQTEEHLYFLYPDPATLAPDDFAQFLEDVAGGRIEAHGGTGLLMRIRRLVYDIVSTVLSIWQASRWLFLLMFGLPTLVVSIICYSLCCMETIDDVRDDDEYDSENEADEADADNAPPPPPLGHMRGPDGDLPPYGEVAGKADESPKKTEEKKND